MSEEKLYTMAEAIVKIQSGEWVSACYTLLGGRITHIIQPGKDGMLKCHKDSGEIDCLFFFSIEAERCWKEYTPEVPFDKSSDEALIGILNRKEVSDANK